MYRFTTIFAPAQIEAIGGQVFLEMQKTGYASVGKFHYLHHQPGGKPHDDVAEHSSRIVAAEQASGIGLTHLPVLYNYGGAGQAALHTGQARFGNDVDRFLQVIYAAGTTMKVLPADCMLGIARHMTVLETFNLASSGVVAGLCPVTKANLGDGLFNGPRYLAAGGAFGMGSDSNVLISLTEELRTLECSQRLRDLSRNVMVAGQGSVGQILYCGAVKGRAQALGRNAGEIATGRLAVLVAIDSAHHALCALAQDQLVDGLEFAARDRVVTDVWSAGRHCVRGGRHMARDAIMGSYRKTMTALVKSL